MKNFSLISKVSIKIKSLVRQTSELKPLNFASCRQPCVTDGNTMLSSFCQLDSNRIGKQLFELNERSGLFAKRKVNGKLI